MGLRRTRGQGESPIHLSLYNSPYADAYPLLMQKMRLDAAAWAALGYTETDRVSATRYLGSLGCRTDDALLVAAKHQQPLTFELAKLLIDAGAFDKGALSVAAIHQRPLSLELAKLLIDTGCDPAAQDGDGWRNGWDVLVFLADGGHPVDPQVTDLFLSAGCRTNLDGCECIEDEQRLRFDQILKEHTQWKEKQDRLLAENSPVDLPVDWSR